MFCLNLIILSQIVFGKEILCHVIRNYKEYPSAVDMANPYISDGLGEVKMSSKKIPITGTTTVDGSVPVVGAVNFDGEVRASGTVTIVARSRPRPRCTATGPLAIMLVTPPKSSKMPRSIIPIILRAKSSPITQGISPISIPALQPITAAATPPIVPTRSFNPVYPAIPNLAVPSYPQEEATECCYIVVSGNEVPLAGTTVVDGVLASSGDITFNGYVPAKGSVVITCKSF
ncbi:endochitinase A1-like isoform X2 [Vanessa atalanta]|uniref:endochitinase A1-like isoform X2 n=1 Tax=Vanessa atalanta TaxID=42275 RepID=UPI001FCD7A66|nr:endochitinase A1-like isoform X2 [Vanessa atalanta]